ncbi:MAG: acyl-CoA synthetase [Gemmatimonadota bacterium]|nr:acyl-CoA synthetase [Gemmatimonadota bacterium]
MSQIPLFEVAATHPGSTAVVDQSGEHSYDWLERRSRLRASQLLGDRADLQETRVAFLMEPGLEYVVTQWAIWRAGGVAVPLSPHHPVPELAHVVDDSGAAILLAADGLEQRLRPLADERGLAFRAIPRGGYDVRPILPLMTGEERASASVDDEPRPLPDVSLERRASILYTSGTTGRPKGVVSTHAALDAQMRAIVDAWEWVDSDRILHVLPLHHTHGIVVALGCALYVGAAVEFAPFEPIDVWNRLASGAVTVFMGVPTMYVKLLRAWEEADDFTRIRWSRGARRLRLATSGSAALPSSVFERWEEVTGRRLLERYGMTEIGMALSNPYDGDRRPGTVGQPLPGIDLRLVRPDDGRVIAEGLDVRASGHTAGEAESGEIRVRGEGVFSEYWGQPEETAASFVDGWFMTGDEAVVEDGYYRILGRRSVDILKSGGYKISAVEIEELLRAHPGVRDCAVVGLPDEEWGERIAAAVVTEEGAWFVPDLSPPGARGFAERSLAVKTVLEPWLRERLAGYKIPRAWRCVDDLPRNTMGKVRKPAVRELFGIAAADSDPSSGAAGGDVE